jgi:hypothetical protein
VHIMPDFAGVDFSDRRLGGSSEGEELQGMRAAGKI